jgi:hypothetical protein
MKMSSWHDREQKAAKGNRQPGNPKKQKADDNDGRTVFLRSQVEIAKDQ